MKKFKIYASKIEYEEEDDKVKILIKEINEITLYNWSYDYNIFDGW